MRAKRAFFGIAAAAVVLAALGIGWRLIRTSMQRTLPEAWDITAVAAQPDELSMLSSAIAAQPEQSSAKPEKNAAQPEKNAAQPTKTAAQPDQFFAQPTKTAAQPPAPPQAVVTVVIPEGFTFYQVARRLEANGVCAAEAFYAAAQTYQVQSFQAVYSKESCYFLEGYLYPDTYEFYQGDKAEAVLRKILNNYTVKSGMPDYQTLILASVIERETRSSEHMAMVSSVFHNRLRTGMRLQADATRAYAPQHIEPAPWVKDPGQYAARYNTYKTAALPVGPICNPGRRAIEAAKHPAASEYLYYFFGDDNTNHYSKTHEEHKAAMARVGVNYG